MEGSIFGRRAITLAADEARESKRCMFFDLPTELRNRIYHLAVVKDKPINIIYEGHLREIWAKPPEQPALTLTCKQLRQEALPVFFGQNSFVLGPIAAKVHRSFRDVAAFWVRACKPFQHLIRSVGAVASRDRQKPQAAPPYWLSVEDHPDQFETVHSYVIVTLLGSGEKAEIWLGGEFEDQCMCSVKFRNWDYKTAHHHVPGGRFIEAAINFSHSELGQRRFSRRRRCTTCGSIHGTNTTGV